MGSLQWSAVRLSDKTDAKGVLDIVKFMGTGRWPTIVYDKVLAGRGSNGPVLSITKVGAWPIALTHINVKDPKWKRGVIRRADRQMLRKAPSGGLWWVILEFCFCQSSASHCYWFTTDA